MTSWEVHLRFEFEPAGNNYAFHVYEVDKISAPKVVRNQYQLRLPNYRSTKETNKL